MTDTVIPPEQLDSMLTSIAGAISFGDANAALELLDAALTVAPDSIEVSLIKADLLADVGSVDDAITVLEVCAAHHGEISAVWQRLAEMSTRRGDSERAVEAVRQWQRLDGPALANETALALAYLADLDIARARQHAKAANTLATDGSGEELTQRLTDIADDADLESEAGWWLYKSGATERGLALLADSLERRDQPVTRRRLATALAHAGRPMDAVAHLRSAVEAAPDRLEWRSELGTVLLAAGDIDGAAECFDQVLSASPDDVSATIGAGRVAITRQDSTRAIELTDGVLSRYPDNAEAWIVRCQAHLAARGPAHALVDAEHAIVLEPSQRHVWATAAHAADAAGQSVFADRYRARASIRLSGSIGLAEGDEIEDLPVGITAELSELDRLVVADGRIRTIYQCRAAIADRLFNPARALAYLDAAIERGTIDENNDSRNDRASLLLATGNVDAADELFRTVLADDPASDRAAQGLADVLRRRPRPGMEHTDRPDVDPPEIKPWTPTHRAPPDGAEAFRSPGGAEPPTTHLDGGLAVQRLERSGKWALLRCENGWECWVDLTLLVPIRETWTPTHVTASGGMASRTAPYAGAEDVGEVTGGLEVEVLSRVGDWAHVRFENEWTCWLAADPLQQRR